MDMKDQLFTDEEIDAMGSKLFYAASFRDLARGVESAIIKKLKESLPLAFMTYKGALLHADDPKVQEASDPTALYDHPGVEVDFDLDGLNHLTRSKAKFILGRGEYKITGFVMSSTNGKCIVDESAVRWFDVPDSFFRMMHCSENTPK